MKRGLLAVAFLFLPLIALETLARLLFPTHGLTFVESTAAAAHVLGPKRAHEKRVFVFGASSVVGYHHLGHSSLSTALAYRLHQMDPHTEWTVVNFGKAGEDSVFVFSSAQASWRYHPDLVLLYAGENEFIPPSIIRRHWQSRVERALLHLKLFRLLRELSGQSTDLSFPDFTRFGYAQVEQEIEAEKPRIFSDYETRVRHLEAHHPSSTLAVVLGPVSNDTWEPSFYDDFTNILYDPKDPLTHRFLEGVLDQENGKPEDARQAFQDVVTARPTFADAQYRLARCWLDLHRVSDAWPHLQASLVNDSLPSRVLPEIDAIDRRQVPAGHYLNLQTWLRSTYHTPLIDTRFIEDNCHPAIQTEWDMARAVLALPAVRQALALPDGPIALDEKAYAHEQGLDPLTRARIDVRIGTYCNGRSSADVWFRQALAMAPDDPAVLQAWHDHQAKAKMLLDKRRQALARLLAS